MVVKRSFWTSSGGQGRARSAAQDAQKQAEVLVTPQRSPTHGTFDLSRARQTQPFFGGAR